MNRRPNRTVASPRVVYRDGNDLAVLLHCPLKRQTISLVRVRVAADQDIHFLEEIPVAQGPPGYLM